MIAAVDVSYLEDKMAVAAAVVFKQFSDDRCVSKYSAVINQFGKYIPGQFFKRELPCLTAILSEIKEELDTVIIDGYVMLGNTPGLGFYLWEKLDRTVSVIGVAKTLFTSANPIKVFRGKSNRPLFITSVELILAQPLKIPQRCTDPIEYQSC